MRFSWCTDFATDWFETCIQDDKKKTYSPENLSYPLKNKWDWKTTYFPFKSWPLFRGHSLVFLGGVVSKSPRTLPSLDIRFPSTGGWKPPPVTCGRATTSYSLAGNISSLPRGVCRTRNFGCNKNPKSFGTKSQWIVGISQPIWESGIFLQNPSPDLRDPNAVWGCRLKKATSKCC